MVIGENSGTTCGAWKNPGVCGSGVAAASITFEWLHECLYGNRDKGLPSLKITPDELWSDCLSGTSLGMAIDSSPSSPSASAE